ncbi:MAG TPA: Uma2 family endonuclease [Gemmatimonadaceae bacterium]|nr:Uma2 family endonuclease [Gemmatimonadaceae bacterium]
MGMPAESRRWSPAEVREMQDGSRAWPRFELIAGELLVTPAPGAIHQIAVGEILMLLSGYVDRENVGVALVSPADLDLLFGTIAQPDVFVAPPAGHAHLDQLRDWSVVTSLLVAVEVISPSSARSDRVGKRHYYLRASVPEYWIVDVDARVIERWSPERSMPAILKDTLEWHPAGAGASLIVDLPALFARIWRKFQLITGA